MATRNISAAYFNGKEKIVKRKRGAHARSMVLRTVDHLQVDEYSASVAEVYDHTTGELHAVLRRTPRQVVVLYKRDPKGHA